MTANIKSDKIEHYDPPSKIHKTLRSSPVKKLKFNQFNLPNLITVNEKCKRQRSMLNDIRVVNTL